MTKLNLLLLCGGGGAEHDISLVSARYIESQLAKLPRVKVHKVEMTQDGWHLDDGMRCHLDTDGNLCSKVELTQIHYVVPCLHGFPGETGDIQSLLTITGLPYLGCDAEGCQICFNKITSKLWFDALGIPNTPYVFITDQGEQSQARASAFLADHQAVFVKAASQGSSVGCYHVTDAAQLQARIADAFTFSDQVLIEKAIKPRELEVAAFQVGDEIIVTRPGEIRCPEGSFYTYEEKYSEGSHSNTYIEAENLTEAQVAAIRAYAHQAFKQLRLKDMSRIDFFLTEDNEILVNEINTFPGMTPISMFPKLMEHHGLAFHEYLASCISTATGRRVN
ncbi:D-alanine--D-alanine ligase A [Salinivibrio kushneri]|uniref:D-alanine--D-alanine ligase n=1 Tax=Salinivibrio kushneri TaxID=1908198 RepID=A0AB36K702_9GAMM|nr:D-alanine--D-alanine ligase [Salinivibrio kushneri]OOE44265.1 D-alanine--D-alanine ligase A [Salinivibrio kushneri]OOE47277.1 D-alanine--D-alanine ligase A [Salinivibrio kushneri]